MKMNEMLFHESDVWELSGIPLTIVKRSLLTGDFYGKEDF